MAKNLKDAWKQKNDLLAKYTKEWKVRSDLVVTAIAWDRGVRLEVGRFDSPKLDPSRRDGKPLVGPRNYAITNRNVTTMRELAQALMDACDFVVESNPEWASKNPPLGS
jgi:hypothetical protein